MATAPKERRKLGAILVDEGFMTKAQLYRALRHQEHVGDMLGRVVVNLGFCDEQEVIEALVVQDGMERVKILSLEIPQQVIAKLTDKIACFYCVIPIREEDGYLVVAMADPLNLQVLDDIGQIVGLSVRGAASNADDVKVALTRYYGKNWHYEKDLAISFLWDELDEPPYGGPAGHKFTFDLLRKASISAPGGKE